MDFDLGDFFLKEVTEDDLLLLPTQELIATVKRRRFSAPISKEDIQKKIENSIPKSTRKNNRCALSVWVAWSFGRNLYPAKLNNGEQKIPSDPNLLTNELLNNYMAHFIQECRRQNGTSYPLNTLVQICSALQIYLRIDCKRADVNFFQKDDTVFAFFRKSLDSRMKELTNQGIGTDTKHADPVLPTDEAQLWDSGVFNTETASGLSNIVFFYNCKSFGFRGMDEHQVLHASQFSISTDSCGAKFLNYTGRLYKNVQGGLHNRSVDAKRISQKSDPTNPRRVVKIYDKYLSLIPRQGRFLGNRFHIALLMDSLDLVRSLSE